MNGSPRRSTWLVSATALALVGLGYAGWYWFWYRADHVYGPGSDGACLVILEQTGSFGERIGNILAWPARWVEGRFRPMHHIDDLLHGPLGPVPTFDAHPPGTTETTGR